MATYTLTTSAQEVGRNTNPVVGARLLAWYSNATSTGATVHLKLQAISQGLTYTGTNKDYEMTLGSTATGTVGWSDAPLAADTWIDVREITQTVNFGNTVGVSGKVWTYVYGDAWITGNSVTMPSNYTKPTKPTVSASSSASTSTSVTYGTTSFGNPSSGTVYLYGGTSSTPTTQINSKSTTGNSTYTHSSLNANTRYYYRARANNGQLWSDYSDTVSTITRPPALTAKSAEVTGTTSVKINFTTAADGGADTKVIQVSRDSGQTWSNVAWVTTPNAWSGNFSVQSLTPGTAYTFSLRVSNASGATSSGSVTATTWKVPETPTVSVTNASASSNTITYGTSSFNTPSNGTVYLYGGTSASPTTQLTSKTTTGNSNYTHSNLAANTTYYYRARAHNSGGDSAYSSDKSIVTRPAAATISVANYYGTSITINYSVPADGGAQPRQIKYSLDSGTTYTNVTTVNTGAASSGSFTISNLTPNTSYTIQVMVSNQSGGSFSTITQRTAYAPTGGTSSITATTWNSATVNASIESYGYPTNNANRKLALGVSASPSTINEGKRENQLALVTSGTTTVTNESIHPGADAITLCGCQTVYSYIWAHNGILANMWLSTTAAYLPPAPLTTLSLTSIEASSLSVEAKVAVAGAAADDTNNKSGSLVDTEYRYKVGSDAFSSWTTLGTSEAPNTSHTITLSNLPFDTAITVEARQVYQSQYSEVKTLSFTTTPKRLAAYGSVSRESKEIQKIYCSSGNATKLVVKAYGSVNGVTKRIY